MAWCQQRVTTDSTDHIVELTFTPTLSLHDLYRQKLELEKSMCALLLRHDLKMLDVETPIFSSLDIQDYLTHRTPRTYYNTLAARQDHTQYARMIGFQPSVDVTVSTAMARLNVALRLTGLALFQTRSGSFTNGKPHTSLRSLRGPNNDQLTDPMGLEKGVFTERPNAMGRVYSPERVRSDAERNSMTGRTGHPGDFRNIADYVRWMCQIPLGVMKTEAGEYVRFQSGVTYEAMLNSHPGTAWEAFDSNGKPVLGSGPHN